MDKDEIFTLQRGRTPLLISMPHVGTVIPDALAPRYTARALEVEDTDWFLDRLYAFAHDLGAGLLVPRLIRSVNGGEETNRICYAGVVRKK